MTFRACSSPAPTPVKPQPAPAILSQESVHTKESIHNVVNHSSHKEATIHRSSNHTWSSPDPPAAPAHPPAISSAPRGQASQLRFDPVAPRGSISSPPAPPPPHVPSSAAPIEGGQPLSATVGQQEATGGTTTEVPLASAPVARTLVQIESPGSSVAPAC
jgi:hypothetical protein